MLEVKSAASNSWPLSETKLEFLAVGRNTRVSATRADPLPIVADEIHTPERLVHTVESKEHDS